MRKIQDLRTFSAILAWSLSVTAASLGEGVPDFYSTGQREALFANGLDGNPPGVLANDIDPTQAVVVSLPKQGEFEFNSGGAFAYVPADNFIGQDHFLYSVGGGEPNPIDITIVGSQSEWKYLNPQGIDPATTDAAFHLTWMTSDFNDTLWLNGFGMMAYGDIDDAIIDTDIVQPDAGLRYTAYFRHQMMIPASGIYTLEITLRRDDGAIIYINGNEVARSHESGATSFAASPDSYQLTVDEGSGAWTGAGDEDVPHTHTVTNLPLSAGTNILAISLHNTTSGGTGFAGSSDLGLKVDSVRLVEFQGDLTPVTLSVSDGALPPVVFPDFYSGPNGLPFNSSVGGISLYANDGLLDETGTPYDEPLEVRVVGVTHGRLTSLNHQTGHFGFVPDPGFIGLAAFSYQVRDKDGWSGLAEVQFDSLPAGESGVLPLNRAQPGGSLLYLGRLPELDLSDPSFFSRSVYLESGSILSAELADTIGGSRIRFDTTLQFRGPDGELVADSVSIDGNAIFILPVRITRSGFYTLTLESQGRVSSPVDLVVFVNGAPDLPGNGRADTASALNHLFVRTESGVEVANVSGRFLEPGSGAPIFEENFNGDLGGRWTTKSTFAEGIIETAANPSDQLRSLYMSSSKLGYANLNEATIFISAQSIGIPEWAHFSTRGFGGQTQPIPSRYFGSVAGDGISVSVDGEEWVGVWSPEQNDGSPDGKQFDFDRILSDAGIFIDDGLYVKFQQYGTGGYDISPPYSGDVRSFGSFAIYGDPPNLGAWFSVQAEEGERLSVRLGSTGAAKVTLYDSTGTTLLAEGETLALGVSGLDYVPGDAANYLIRVLGGVFEYNLSVAKSGALDREPNDTIAQPFAFKRALGVLQEGGEPTEFAFLADYGNASTGEAAVSRMIKNWDPDFIVTGGNNNFGPPSVGNPAWEENVGFFFGEFIQARANGKYPYQTSEMQRFFPAVGNEDTDNGSGVGGPLNGYIDYFVSGGAGGTPRLPLGNGKHETLQSYYRFQQGPIEFFMLDSDHAIASTSSLAEQRAWLADSLANSTASWKVVVMHHPPYCSDSISGGNPEMVWNEWRAADLLLSGHSNVYERLDLGDPTLLVCGLGGHTLGGFGTPLPESIAQYNINYGALRIRADGANLLTEFRSVESPGSDGLGEIADSLTLSGIGADTTDADLYSVVLAADSPVVIASSTPDLPGSISNPLVPRIEILASPGGATLAAASGNAADGKNALLDFTPATAGTYIVRVTSAAGSGEYGIQIAPSFSSWVFAESGGDQPPAALGPLEDPDRDGVKTVFEYAFGTPPFQPGQPFGAPLHVGIPANGLIELQLDVADPFPPDAWIEVWHSESMAPGTWQRVAGKLGTAAWIGSEVSISPSGSGQDHVTIYFYNPTSSAASAGFFQIAAGIGPPP